MKPIILILLGSGTLSATAPGVALPPATVQSYPTYVLTFTTSS